MPPLIRVLKGQTMSSEKKNKSGAPEALDFNLSPVLVVALLATRNVRSLDRINHALEIARLSAASKGCKLEVSLDGEAASPVVHAVCNAADIPVRVRFPFFSKYERDEAREKRDDFVCHEVDGVILVSTSQDKADDPSRVLAKRIMSAKAGAEVPA